MQLQIKPYHKNTFPIGGILIRSSSVSDWLIAVQELNLSFNEITVYPIPANKPNSIWGCLIQTTRPIDKRSVGRNEFFQVVHPNLFIAEHTLLFPAITTAEIQKLFGKGRHIFHPDFGLVELQDELNPDELIEQPTLRSFHVSRPVAGAFIPQMVRSIRVEAISPEETLKNLEDKVFPQKEQMKQEPLNLIEKGKLLLYRKLFKNGNASFKKAVVGNAKESGAVEQLLAKLLENTVLAERMQQDFEDLEERNKKEVDKLLDLLKKNPEEALKYAIPLDETGATRGRNNGQFNLQKLWNELLFSGKRITNTARAGTVDLGDRFFDLRQQYMNTALELIKKEKYHDAAFVYMKLLKNPQKAAEVLEAGGYFQDAATIYLKHTGNKRKAAECYERGKMIIEAIDIYKELQEDEKVGDLYAAISRKNEADVYYRKVADGYADKDSFVKASLIYKRKIGSISEAQSLLLRGWQTDKDAINCLCSYFANITNIDELKKETNRIYKNERGPWNGEKFLSVIKYVYSNHNELSEPIREMAYEIIAENVKAKPYIVSELKHFNPNDKELIKDTLRYKMNKK